VPTFCMWWQSCPSFFLCAFLSLVSLHQHLVFWLTCMCVCIVSWCTDEKKSPIGSPALSKTGDNQTYQNSPTNKKLKGFLVRNTSVPPETKFTITFCANYTCDGNRDCYCCLHDGNDVCYWTRADCQAECPACAPHCPPLPQPRTALMEGRP